MAKIEAQGLVVSVIQKDLYFSLYERVQMVLAN
jgi:hypothetical protein